MSAASTCEQIGLDPPCFLSILCWYIQRVSCRKYFNQSTLGLWVSLTGFCQNWLFRWKRLTSNLFCTDSIVFNLSSHTFDAFICCQVLCWTKNWGFVLLQQYDWCPQKILAPNFFKIWCPPKNYGPILKNRSRQKCRIRAVSGLKPWNLHFPLKTVCFVRGCLGMSQLFIWWWRRRMHLRQTLSKSKFQKVPVSDDRNYFHCTLLERLVSSNKELVLHWLFMFALAQRWYSPPCVSKATNFLFDIFK